MTDVLDELRRDLADMVTKIDRIGGRLTNNDQIEALTLACGLVANAAMEVGRAVETGRRNDMAQIARRN